MLKFYSFYRTLTEDCVLSHFWDSVLSLYLTFSMTSSIIDIPFADIWEKLLLLGY